MKKSRTEAIVAAFDFDGTVTYRDTLVSFLFFAKNPLKATLNLLLDFPVVLGFLLGLIPRQQAKERVLTRFFAGMPEEQICGLGRLFAEEKLPKHIRPKALERIRWHVSQGHTCVLISASLELYLKPWAESIGFQQVMASRMKVDEEDRISGKLLGSNCWGPEKVRRLEEALGQDSWDTLFAYGDSRGDRELLALADYPYYRTQF